MHKIRPAREAPRDTLAVFKGSTSEKTGEGDGRRTGGRRGARREGKGQPVKSVKPRARKRYSLLNFVCLGRITGRQILE